MRPEVSYVPYATSYHEQTGNIITFSHFEEVDLLENERNSEEEESILDSIDESYTEDESDDGSISTNVLGDIRCVSQIHPELNARDAGFKICHHIIRTKKE